MNVTIKDIAARAGVSYASVSRALTGKPGVSDETRQKILKLAGEMHYQPNAMARSMVKKRTKTLGLIIPDILNPFFPEIARGVEDAAHARGYSIFLCNSSWNPQKERRYMELLVQRRVDGIILVPVDDHKSPADYRGLLEDRFPLLFLSAEADDPESLCLRVDNLLGGYMAASLVLKKGCRKLAFVGGESGKPGVNERLEGARRAAEEAGTVLPEERVVLSGFGMNSGVRAIRELLDGPDLPDAVIAENDDIAMGVLQGAREMGVAIPGELSVVGFDNIPASAIMGIDLTTIGQPKYKMGEMAVDMLLSHIDGDTSFSRQVVLEPVLIERKTT